MIFYDDEKDHLYDDKYDLNDDNYLPCGEIYLLSGDVYFLYYDYDFFNYDVVVFYIEKWYLSSIPKKDKDGTTGCSHHDQARNGTQTHQ